MKKVNMLIISGASAIILFVILTIVQGKLLNKEVTIPIYIANNDILCDSPIMSSDYSEIKVPISLVEKGNAISNIKDLDGKYAKEIINKGQVIFYQDISTKEELKIIDSIEGLERVAVKIKSSENAVAYQIKPKDRIHLYFTGKTGVIENTFNKYGLNFNNTLSENSLQTEKIIENIEILGIYDEIGRSYENSEFSGLDTIVIAVIPEKAAMINNLRTQGTFDITR